ncbi:MAG: 30S ribosomal protein S24e [Candidatus Caldarchaeum sp.]|nr:30S ribosomal protein S24e [Candidatus Caldarchaeum sp.]
MSLMDVKMVENRLVGRREVIAKLSYTAPLKRDEVKQILANHFGIEPKKVVIRKIKYLTGTKFVETLAHIYDSDEKIKVYEPLYILVRNKLAERPKK